MNSDLMEVVARRRGTFPLTVIGVIESRLVSTERAPRQGSDGAPDAWLVLDPGYALGLTGIASGDNVLVVTWLHRARREVLRVYPRDGVTHTSVGVFATRSPHRPNPLGLHRVTVRRIAGTRIRIGPIEVIDGTPVVDVKAALGHGDD